MREHKPNKTQRDRVLDILKSGEWVDGMTFLNLDSPILQYHARIWELQNLGFVIEGRTIADRSWKEYRLIEVGVKTDKAALSPTGLKPAPSTKCCYSFGFYGFHSSECDLLKVEKKELGMLF